MCIVVSGSCKRAGFKKVAVLITVDSAGMFKALGAFLIW